jgi:sec-independent protein translocase protein TatA
MYLFILESIGTSELLLIGLVALIFFGPRKLPDLARTLGKVMNEFRRTSNDFKQTWEKEVASEINQLKEDTSFSSLSENLKGLGNQVERNSIAAPLIKEVSHENIQPIPIEIPKTQKSEEKEEKLTDKQNWL